MIGQTADFSLLTWSNSSRNSRKLLLQLPRAFKVESTKPCRMPTLLASLKMALPSSEPCLIRAPSLVRAGARIRTTAFTSDTRLTDSEVKFGLSLATNQLPPNLPSHCFCGLPLTVEHTISCPSGRAKLHRHNRLVNLFVSFASFHGVSHELVPRLTYEDCKNSLVPDAKFFLPLTVVQVDVSVVSPLCPTNLPATARNGGTALLA